MQRGLDIVKHVVTSLSKLHVYPGILLIIIFFLLWIQSGHDVCRSECYISNLPRRGFSQPSLNGNMWLLISHARASLIPHSPSWFLFGAPLLVLLLWSTYNLLQASVVVWYIWSIQPIDD